MRWPVGQVHCCSWQRLRSHSPCNGPSTGEKLNAAQFAHKRHPAAADDQHGNHYHDAGHLRMSQRQNEVFNIVLGGMEARRPWAFRGAVSHGELT